MPGSYCRYCNQRCFLYRVIPSGPCRGWGGHLATCPGGMAHDRAVTGHDHTTAINPITNPAAADVACTWTWRIESLVPIMPKWRLSRPVSVWDTDRTATGRVAQAARNAAVHVLSSYLAEVATDAGLPRNDPAAQPAYPLRVTVWPGPQPGERHAAAAVTTWRAAA
jgi:hypothetical protein